MYKIIVIQNETCEKEGLKWISTIVYFNVSIVKILIH